MKNNRGFTGFELVVIGAVITLLLAGPQIIKSFGTLTSGGDKNQTKITHKVKQYQTPFYQDSKGNFIPASKQDRIEIDDSNFISQPVRASIWDSIKKYAVIIAFLCIAFPSFGVWLFKRFIDMKNNFSQLVTGIEQAKKKMAPDQVTLLETSLSKKTNLDTKALVKKVKANIKEDDLK